MKQICVLLASPRKSGNTEALTMNFIEHMRKYDVNCTIYNLYNMDIRPCIACRHCQQDWSTFNCWQKDDVQEIFDSIMQSDSIILCSPIYSWYCTTQMKSLLDRLVYGMNKYYGEEKGPSLWKGKNVAIITTCGYKVEKGADLWEEGVKRYCKHSMLNYIGMLAKRHMGYKSIFMDDEKKQSAIDFAQKILEL